MRGTSILSIVETVGGINLVIRIEKGIEDQVVGVVGYLLI